MLYLDLFRTFVSKMCPEVSEKPKGDPKGVSLNIKLDVNIFGMILVGHFWGSGNAPNCFHINYSDCCFTLCHVRSLRFHRNTLLMDSRRNLYHNSLLTYLPTSTLAPLSSIFHTATEISFYFKSSNNLLVH